MGDGITEIAGIEIPSANPVFLTVVGVHILLGLACVITGAMAMLSEKRAGRHPRNGTIYFWSLAGDFVRELRIQLDPAIECPVALAPLIDPNEHSCGTVRPHGARELAQAEPGFYFAGMKSYGRAPTFLMITGYEQVRSIAAELAGDREAAERVELVLPETGVCNRTAAPDANNCCGGPALSDVDACCVDDANAKRQGRTGCGCG